MYTDINLLNEYIKKAGYKKTHIAKELKLSNQGFSNKITGKSDFSVPEILKLCDLLKIKNDVREKIFFTLNVDETSTNSN